MKTLITLSTLLIALTVAFVMATPKPYHHLTNENLDALYELEANGAITPEYMNTLFELDMREALPANHWSRHVK